MTIRFAVIGLDHRHIYGMSQGMIDAGAVLAGYWTEGKPQPLEGFARRFPDVPCLTELDAVLDDEDIELVLIAAAPGSRADLAIAAMRHGKEVMVDKPGCITEDELRRLSETVEETGRSGRSTSRNGSKSPQPRWQPGWCARARSAGCSIRSDADRTG